MEAVKAYAHEQKMDPSTKVNVAYNLAASAGVFRKLAPISYYNLEDGRYRIIQEKYE